MVGCKCGKMGYDGFQKTDGSAGKHGVNMHFYTTSCLYYFGYAEERGWERKKAKDRGTMLFNTSALALANY